MILTHFGIAAIRRFATQEHNHDSKIIENDCYRLGAGSMKLDLNPKARKEVGDPTHER